MARIDDVAAKIMNATVGATYIMRKHCCLLGEPEWWADAGLAHLVEAGQLFALETGKGRRYFTTREAFVDGEKQFAAEKIASVNRRKERRRAREKLRVRTRVVQKPVVTPKKSLPPTRHAPRREAIYPPGLKFTEGPHFRDRRFTVEGPIIGGFLDEFRALCGHPAHDQQPPKGQS